MTQIALPDTDLVQTEAVNDAPVRPGSLSRRIARPAQALRAVPHVGTWAGVLLAAIGAVLLVVAWVKVAALTNVALQLPYVVSAGFTGLGLVAVGLTVVNLAAKQEDARERSRQAAELRGLLAELRTSLRPEDDT
jgi:hypothetical protein